MADIIPITHSATLPITRDPVIMADINATLLPLTFSSILDLTGPNPYV